MSRPKPRNRQLWLYMLQLGLWRTTGELLIGMPVWGKRPSDRRAMSASLRTFARARMVQRRLRADTRDYEYRVTGDCVAAQGVKLHEILEAAS